MTTTNKITKLNPLAWVRRLYFVGTIRRFADRGEEIAAEIARREAEIKELRANLRKLDKDAEKAALECGYTADQVAAARGGETLSDNGNRWAS